MPFRIAAVSFLNTRPLIHGLDGDPRVTVFRDLPSRLAARLESGEADVALLPVVEAFRGRSGGILPGTGIACRGEVASVKLFGRSPLEETATVRADRGSRTSVALTDILLRETLGRPVPFVEAEPRPDDPPAAGEAVLAIGDRCLACDRTLSGPEFWSRDLGAWWEEATGLPFVFAVWAVRPGFDPGRAGELLAILTGARDRGLAALDEIAAEAAAEGLPGHGGEATADAIAYYLRHDLVLRLAEAEMRGLARFHELCVRYDLVPGGPFPAVLEG